MSIAIATLGMFKGCVVAGGAPPPYRPDNVEQVKPTIRVTKVEMTSTNNIEEHLSEIKANLVSFD